MRRLRLAVVSVLLAASALALACTSFRGDDSVDPAGDSSVPSSEAAASPEGGSEEGGSEADAGPRLSFCEVEQKSAKPHALCADFEGIGLTRAWRGASLENDVWTADHKEDLDLTNGGPPKQPGFRILQATTDAQAPAPGAEDGGLPNVASGSLTFQTAKADGLRIAFDLNVDQAAGNLTPFDINLAPSATSAGSRIYMSVTVNAQGLGVVFVANAQSGDATMNYGFAPGSPSLLRNWRHFVVDLQGVMFHVTVDDFDAIPLTQLPGFVALPASGKVRVGAPFFKTGPWRVLFDNVTIDTSP